MGPLGVTRMFDLTRLTLCFFALTSCSLLYDADIKTLNELQVMGSHNSYKGPLIPKVKQILEESDSEDAFLLDYSHGTLTEQLNIGLRQLELDVLLDPSGSRFSKPYIQSLVPYPVYTVKELRDLSKPGLKVLHVPNLDIKSHCILFEQCLQEIKTWSSLNSGHLPVFILLNVKESGFNPEVGKSSHVLQFDEAGYREIDEVIKHVLSEKLIKPDDIRSRSETLNSEVIHSGWPDTDTFRGKFFFIFDGNEKQREIYRSNHPSLQGRSMFASYEEGSAEAAFMIINDPVNNFCEIQRLVRKGYMVRTRADDGNPDGKAHNYQRAYAAINSGAQIVSTDFYKGSVQAKKMQFSLVLHKNTPFSRFYVPTFLENCISPKTTYGEIFDLNSSFSIE